MKTNQRMKNVKATVLGTVDYVAGQANSAVSGKRKVFTLLGTGVLAGAATEPLAARAVSELRAKVAIIEYLKEQGMKADSQTVNYMAAAVRNVSLLSEPIAQDNKTNEQKGPGVGTTTVTWTGITETTKKNETTQKDETIRKEMEVGLRIESKKLAEIFGMKDGFTENWIGYRREVKGLEMVGGKDAIINLYIGQEGLIIVVVPKDSPTAQNAKTLMIPLETYIDQTNEYRIQLEGSNLIVLGADGNAYIMNVDQSRLASTSANWDGKGDVKLSMETDGKFAVTAEEAAKEDSKAAGATVAPPLMRGRIIVEEQDTVDYIPGITDLTKKSSDKTAKVGVVTSQTGKGASESKNIAIEGGETPVGNAYNYEMNNKQMETYLGDKTFVKADRTINALAWSKDYRGMPKLGGEEQNAKAVVIVPNSKNADGTPRDAYPFDLTYADRGGQGTMNRIGNFPAYKRMNVAVTESKTNDVGLVTGSNKGSKAPKHLTHYDATMKVSITVENMTAKNVTGIQGTANEEATTLKMMTGKKKSAGTLKVDKPMQVFVYDEIAVKIGSETK